MATVVFVPGFWEGPEVFAAVQQALKATSIHTVTASLVSTGRSSPNNPTMHDDVAAVRSLVESLLHEQKEVILVLHSAAGYIGTQAAYGLSVAERGRQGRNGGVTGFVFIAAGIFEPGMQTGSLPFFDYQVRPCPARRRQMLTGQGDQLRCKDPRHILFNDLSEVEAASWADRLRCQPASGWDGTIQPICEGLERSIYLICEGDQAVPLPVQRQFAASAGSKLVSCSAGHMAMLSQPDKVVSVVRQAQREFSREQAI